MKFFVDTERPVAVDSLDHLYPLGTKNDNSANLEFNKRLMKLIDHNPISVLDLGCAGGKMVKTFLDMKQIAVGIEGSDYSLKRKRAEWATIPDYLFTADATYPFTVHTGDHEPYKFDAVTAWEFVEHIEKDDLPKVMENVLRHSKPGAYMVVSTTDTVYNTIGVKHHRTCKPMGWWIKFFEEYGFIYHKELESYFTKAWVRPGLVSKYKMVMRLEVEASC